MNGYNEILKSVCDRKTREQATGYFREYWLEKHEYLRSWLPIQNSIFDSRAQCLPDFMFNQEFDLFALVGGDIFVSRDDFRSLQSCMREVGDTNFVIIQNKNIVFEGAVPTRFKYRTDVTWDELMSGGIVGSEHFRNGCKDYFLFGDSAAWGRYVANSWIVPGNETSLNPINIMGFRKPFSQMFRNSFERIRRQEPEITPDILLSEWVPEAYKPLLA